MSTETRSAMMLARDRVLTVLSAATVIALAITGCTSTDDEPPAPEETASATPDGGETAQTPEIPENGDTGEVSLGETTEVASGFEAPWSIAFVGDTALISERDSGRILELTPDGSMRTVHTLEDIVQPDSGGGMGPEGGLLGLAVDQDEQLYVYSTGAEGNRIQRFGIDGEPGALELGEPETILTGLGSGMYHNGGRIAFGPDGMLYVTVGDAGQPEESQDLDSLNGKILRVSPDGDVPEDNPFEDSYVYSYGHRNPQGIAWAEDGTMFSTEFGASTFDELNIITPGGNYGWPEAEGVADDPDYEDPVQQWEPAEASPSGMTIIGGTIVIANLRGEVLRTVPVADPGESNDYFDGDYGRIRDVVPTPDGDLWLLTNNTDGRGDPSDGDDQIIEVEVTE